LQYEKDFQGGLHMLARATLEDDGVRFRYEFVNRSEISYEMIYAPTDPRLTSIFHDVRLERTYVHHKDGFDLLASETPGQVDHTSRSMATCTLSGFLHMAVSAQKSREER